MFQYCKDSASQTQCQIFFEHCSVKPIFGIANGSAKTRYDPKSLKTTSLSKTSLYERHRSMVTAAQKGHLWVICGLRDTISIKNAYFCSENHLSPASTNTDNNENDLKKPL